MFKHYLRFFAVCSAAVVCNAVCADEAPTRIVFSGASGQEKALRLSQYNRFTFGDKGITASSSRNPDVGDVELLYSQFNHIEFGNESLSVLDELPAQGGAIAHNPSNHTLTITTTDNTSTEAFAVGVFDTAGTMLIATRALSGEAISIDGLPSGVYIAIARRPDFTLKLKFIIR